MFHGVVPIFSEVCFRISVKFLLHLQCRVFNSQLSKFSNIYKINQANQNCKSYSLKKIRLDKRRHHTFKKSPKIFSKMREKTKLQTVENGMKGRNGAEREGKYRN